MHHERLCGTAAVQRRILTADRTKGVTHQHSDQDSTVNQNGRVYYGDGGEEIDSQVVTGLVNRQVRE